MSTSSGSDETISIMSSGEDLSIFSSVAMQSGVGIEHEPHPSARGFKVKTSQGIVFEPYSLN